MKAIHQSHKKGSPELIAIAQAKSKGKPFMVEGLPYTLGDWQSKEGRVLITLVPFREELNG